MPDRLVQVEIWVPPVRFCFVFFFVRGSQREGGIDPDAGISPCANGETRLPDTLRRKNIPMKTYMLGVNRQVEYLAWL